MNVHQRPQTIDAAKLDKLAEVAIRVGLNLQPGQDLFLTAPVLSQHAGLAAMDAREELEGHVAVYRRNRELLLEALPSLGLTSIAPPDGAFYIWADIGHLTDDSLAFCERLLRDTGVATAPGVDFDPVDGRRFMRFSFAVSTAEVEEAITRMTPWFAAQTAAG